MWHLMVRTPEPPKRVVSAIPSSPGVGGVSQCGRETSAPVTIGLARDSAGRSRVVLCRGAGRLPRQYPFRAGTPVRTEIVKGLKPGARHVSANSFPYQGRDRQASKPSTNTEPKDAHHV